MNNLKNALKNMNYKKAIQFSFFGIIILVAILGIVSTTYIRNISERTSTLYNRPHTNLVSMWTIKAEVAEVGSLLKEAVLSNTAVSPTAAEMVTNVSELIMVIEGNKVNPTEPMSEDMTNIVNAIGVWSSSFTQMSDLLSQGNYSAITTDMIAAYNEAEADLTSKMNNVINTASTNALKFKNQSESMASSAMILMIVLFVFALLFTTWCVRTLTTNFAKPMSVILHAANNIAEGNLHEDIIYEKQNEFGSLVHDFNVMQTYLNSVVSDLDRILDEMGHGNFNIDTNIEYIGDFSPILDSIHRITQNLSSTLQEINIASEQVSGGANQMSSGAMVLSEGATDQAAAIEELSATVSSVSDQINKNAENASAVTSHVEKIVNEIINDSQNMSKMTTAMENISEKSNEIANIIHVIEDIASETNLLSLNASIEAARAGEAGKGFAVVADAVKGLAEQSAQAVQNTNLLIAGSLEAVDIGTKIAQETQTNLSATAENAKSITKNVEEISIASREQSLAVAQITEGIDQISSVIQSNSATAQETAAASEELSSQAQILKEKVQRFKLKF